jgi:hypothetical protein
MNSQLLTPVVMQVDEFSEDATPPTLVEFTVNMHTHEIAFSFSETVARDEFVVAKVTVVGTNEEAYTLTDGNMIETQEAYSTTLVWKLGDTDANELKRRRFTAVSTASSGIFMAEGAVLDANDRRIVEFTSVHPCSDHTPDGKAPELRSYILDLTAGTITMEFSETIKSSSLVAVGVSLLSAQGATSADSVVPLTSGSLKVDLDSDAVESTKSDWLTAVIALSEADLNAIKKRTALATDVSTTYLTIAGGVITDMNNNPVRALDAENAQIADDFVEDDVVPVLRSFALDMSNRLLTLSFSETMLASTIAMDASDFIIFPHSTGVVLTSSSKNVDAALEDSNVITIKISEEDANKMKIAGSGRTLADSSLQMQPFLANDMNNNAVALTNLDLINANFLEDTIPPVMRSASVDMNVGTLTIVFDETVKADSLDASTITVQLDAAGTVSHTLQGPGTNLNVQNSPTIVVKIEDADLNAIKLKAMLTKLEDSYVYLAEGTVTDTSVAATESDAHGDAAIAFKVDETPPALTAFSFDLTTKSLILSFDEVVKASSVVETEITLWSHENDAAAENLGETRTSYTLVDVTVNSPNGLELELVLSDEDLDAIKAITNLFISPGSSYMSFNEDVVTDMAVPANKVTPVLDTSAERASAFKADNLQPAVESFDLDMTAELLTIYFSETVDSDSVVFPAITLQKSATVGTSAHGHVSLTGGKVTHTTDIPSLQIKLSTADVNRLKTAKIGMDTSSTYLTMTAAAVTDMAGLDLIPREDGNNAVQVDQYNRDNTDPVLQKCALDLTNEELTLSFSETVDASSIIVSHITLAQDAGGIGTTYSLHSPSGTSSEDGPEIVVDISLTDLNEIKRLNEHGLATIEDEAASVYCSVSVEFINDVFENPVVVRELSDGLPSTDFVTDGVAPKLKSFTLDMNQVISENTVQVATATLLMKFSETVKFNSYDPKFLTIQKAETVSGTGSSVTLTGQFSSVSTQSGTQLAFKMLRADANAIKLVADMATGEDDTYLTLDSSFVTDMYNNPIESVDNGAAMKIADGGFVADVTAPELMKFDIDMDAGKITLSFDETVSGLSINPDEIIIRDTTDENNAAASFTLTGGLVGSATGEPWVKATNVRTFPHSDSHIIQFYFTKDDLDEIKRLNMCTDANDCYLVHTEFVVYDMRENDVLRCT